MHKDYTQNFALLVRMASSGDSPPGNNRDPTEGNKALPARENKAIVDTESSPLPQSLAPTPEVRDNAPHLCEPDPL